jgi:hypothetical protein
MKTPEQWLEEILSNDKKFTKWLERQYIGEMLAWSRIMTLTSEAKGPKEAKLLAHIANDEKQHAEWIGSILFTFDIKLPTISYEDDRYWREVLPNTFSQDSLYAAGYHAEGMRLARIKLLATDKRVPGFIRSIFKAIYKDEQFHVKAFGAMASDEAKKAMKHYHMNGLRALGLVL